MWHATLWRRIDGRWLVALIALEVVAGVLLLVPRGEVASAGAGIGEYAASLAAGHGYSMPVPCGQLDHARRMPLAPMFLAAVALAGGGVWSALLARLVLLLGVLVAAIASQVRGKERWWRDASGKLLLLLLAASPVFAKHLTQLGYEEGFSLVLVPALVLVGLAVIAAPEARPERIDVAFGALVAGVFLVKSGYLLLCLVGASTLGWAAIVRRRRSAWLGLLLALAAPLGWMLFVLSSTGRVEAGTSWDGENLFRGWCSACARVYPWQSLDRIFDSAAIATPDGVVPAPAAPPRCAFPSEWAWSDHYRDRALASAGAAPREAFEFLSRKLWVVLAEVRPVPRVGGLDVTRSAVVVGSFVLLRGAALAALVLAWRRRALLAHFTASLWFSAACCGALCVPLLVGFAYDRHSVVLLVAFLSAAAGIASRARERMAAPR
ncbi:MAG TPA: hypothetical protein VMG12_20310 [Polyangiaceae bacterium]|nr:hypothetical protein [Polyangiaceae bacterium]